MNKQEWFKEKGYGEAIPHPIYRADGAVSYYKKVPDTEKHQFVVNEWPALREGHANSFELEMTYETEGEVWCTTKFYGLSFESLKENLDRLERALRTTVGVMGGNPWHYRMDGQD